MRAGRVYVIEWMDHCDSNGENAWINVSDIDAGAVYLRSVGYVVKLTEESVVIAHTLQGGQASSPFTIVRSAVVRSEEIKLPPMRRPKKAKVTP